MLLENISSSFLTTAIEYVVNKSPFSGKNEDCREADQRQFFVTIYLIR
jgi:hypothetical protein